MRKPTTEVCAAVAENDLIQGMRLALYGGSFDPIHLGHLLVATAALQEFQLDFLSFVPVAQSPFKPERKPAPARFRLRWLRLALAGQTKCRVDDLEIRRGGVSFTIDTVRHYRQRFPQASLFCLIGEDHVSQLPKWREAEELARSAEFILVPRPGASFTEVPPGFSIHRLRGHPLALSSSEIRARVQAGLPIEHLVPESVAHDLLENRLYLD